MSAPLATHLLITARTSDGISLFLVDLDAVGPGLVLHGYRTVDDRRAADLELTGLRLPTSVLATRRSDELAVDVGLDERSATR